MSQDIRMSKDIPNRMSKIMSKEMPERMSERTSKGTPKRMSEDMPEKRHKTCQK